MRMKYFNFLFFITVFVFVFMAFMPMPQAAIVSGTFNSIAIDSQKATYGAAVVQATPAATATDVFTLSGSSTKTIVIRKIIVSGVATAAGNMDVSIVKHTVADSGGTKGTAPTVGLFDSYDVAATATPVLYTANPTVDASGVILMNQMLNFGVAGAAGTITFDFSRSLDKPVYLHGAAQQIAINLNGQTVPTTGKISFTVEWQEF